ncbi:MAG TPA: hypothetical protein VM580_33815 [Labilithrix sp.]|nr:hypothetical protein [Labilithrix sp.]
MQLRSVTVIALVLVTGLATFACTGGGGGSESDTQSNGSGGNGAPTCASTGKRICERACACGNGSECQTGIPNSFGTFTTLTWSDFADCEAGYAVSRCKEGGSPAVDYAACASAIDAATCQGDVFVVPSGCEAPRDAGK